MRNQTKAYLLQIIRKNGEITPLLEHISFGEISVLLDSLIHDGLVVVDESSHLSLSESGIKTLETLKKIEGKKTNRFIEPQIAYKTDSILLDDIYLPEIKSVEDLK